MKTIEALPLIDTRHLFRPLDDALITLLQSLGPVDWEKKTLAKRWKVKDVVAHLLDGNIRTLSAQKEKYFGDTPPEITSNEQLIEWLNNLNSDWVKAMQRVSPSLLTMLLESTGKLTSDFFESSDLDQKANFPVDWAGERESKNWMHIAREYTEKWHHQQQIRVATGQEGIMSDDYFLPVLDTFMRALPYTFQHVFAAEGTVIKVQVNQVSRGNWFLVKTSGDWRLSLTPPSLPKTVVEIEPQVSWRLFCKNVRPDEIDSEVKIQGDRALGQRVLEMVSVMA